MDKKYAVGNFICQLRQEKGLTQKELGELLGVTNKAVSKWENGSAMPRLKYLQQLAIILGCTQEELFLGRRVIRENDTAFERIDITAEYRSVIERCNCCRHAVKRVRRRMVCTTCGVQLVMTGKSKLLFYIPVTVLCFVFWLACYTLAMLLTSEIFLNAFPTAEEAALHSLLLETFPYLKINGFCTILAFCALAGGLSMLSWKLMEIILKPRLTYRIIRYPYSEDGKIIF